MTAPAPVTSDYDNRRLEQALGKSATTLSGYRRRLVQYALDLAGNLPVDPASALASRGAGSGIGDGSRTDLIRLAKELQAGLDAMASGILELEQPLRGTGEPARPGAGRSTPTPASVTPAPMAAATAPSNTLRRDLLRMAGQAATVEHTARRAAANLSQGSGERRGLLRRLTAGLGMALLRAGLALSAPATGNQSPSASGADQIDQYVAAVLRLHLNHMQNQLTDINARLEALGQHRETRAGMPTEHATRLNLAAATPPQPSGTRAPRLAMPGRVSTATPAPATGVDRFGRPPRPGSPDEVQDMELLGAHAQATTTIVGSDLPADSRLGQTGATDSVDGLA